MNIVIIIAGFYLVLLAAVMDTNGFGYTLAFKLTPLVLGVIILLSKAQPIMAALGK